MGKNASKPDELTSNLFGERTDKRLVKRTLLKMMKENLTYCVIELKNKSVVTIWKIKKKFLVSIKNVYSKVKTFLLPAGLAFAILTGGLFSSPAVYATDHVNDQGKTQQIHTQSNDKSSQSGSFAEAFSPQTVHRSPNRVKDNEGNEGKKSNAFEKSISGKSGSGMSMSGDPDDFSDPEDWSDGEESSKSESKNQHQKMGAEQAECGLNENITRKVNEKFESNAVKKIARTALSNQKVKQDYEIVKKRLIEGVNPIDIGKKSAKVSSNKVLIKGAYGRYVVEISGNEINILGIGARGNYKNITQFSNAMNKTYGLNLQY